MATQTSTTLDSGQVAEDERVLDPEAVEHAEQADTEVPPPAAWHQRLLENLAHRVGHRQLVRLAQRRGHVARTLRHVPQRMHRVANQTRLVLELIDDFIDGNYRAISWRALALLVGAVLYTVSPADVIPDWLPGVGALDDLAGTVDQLRRGAEAGLARGRRVIEDRRPATSEDIRELKAEIRRIGRRLDAIEERLPAKRRSASSGGASSRAKATRSGASKSQ
jgi:uncharacterized membrane protein YkvA (DUF1232 family)